MKMTLDDFVRRAEELISQADAVAPTRQESNWGTPWVDEGLFSGFRAAALSFLKNLFGARHPYYTDFEVRCSNNVPDHLSAGREILVAARDELEGGWFRTARGLIAAEIFADFLDMASHLLAGGYTAAAAVMTGSVLEEHFRQLCEKHGIPIEISKPGSTVPKKADALNAELTRADAYNKLDQKNVTAWLDLRNKAAHGKYKEYTKEQVELMHGGVTEFMARNSV